MNLFFRIVKNDLHLIFRDKSLLVMFIIPVVFVLVCRLGIPYLTVLVPNLPGYYWLVVSAFASVAASTPSFLFGFILLDERDENVSKLLQILPLPENYILKIRVVFIVFLGFLFSFFILALNGLVFFPLVNLLALAFLFALIPPVLTFTIATFAKNKIEAATFYKGLSVLLFVPVAAFFIDRSWKYVFGIIPFFWTFESVQAAREPVWFIFAFALSVLMHSALSVLLYRLYKKRNS